MARDYQTGAFEGWTAPDGRGFALIRINRTHAEAMAMLEGTELGHACDMDGCTDAPEAVVTVQSGDGRQAVRVLCSDCGATILTLAGAMPYLPHVEGEA